MRFVVRWVVVVLMGLATFYPEWGIAAMAYKFFPAAPAPITCGALVWVIAMALALPLSLRIFQVVSTAAITAICSTALWLLAHFYSGVFAWWPFWLWGVLVLFIDFGWLMISTTLWRWARGVVVTQQTADHAHQQ